jgi:tetratricopeptide (TPR) repeat protein
LNDFNKAVGFFKQYYDIAHEINEKLNEVTALENLGRAYISLGDFPNVIECFEKALIIDKELESHQSELLHLDGLGMAYLSLGISEGEIKAAKIADIHERQLALARERKDPFYEGIALGRLGSLYYIIEEKEEGIRLTKQALKIFEANGAPASSVNATREILRLWGIEETSKNNKRKRRKKRRSSDSQNQ